MSMDNAKNQENVLITDTYRTEINNYANKTRII